MLRSRHLSRECHRDERRAGLVHVVDGADAVLWTRDRDFLLAPSALELVGSDGVLDGQPARALDLLLQDEELKHALLGAEYALKGVASEVGWEGRHGGWILDLEDFVLTMLQRSLESILSANALALEHRDVLKSTLAHLLQLRVNICQEFVLFLAG